MPTGLSSYSTQDTLSKVRDILSEIEKENTIKGQEQQIQEFEELAKSVKNLIPKVFDHLISKVAKAKEVREGISSSAEGQPSEEQGVDRANTSSSEVQVPSETFLPDSDSGDTDSSQEQQLEGVAGSGGINGKQAEETEDRGNCTIDSSMEEILKSQGESKESYYLVSCTNITFNGGEDSSFGSRWWGAFPRMLFNSRDLNTLNKLEIKVKTEFPEDPEEDDFPYNIEFWSKQFTSYQDLKIIGKWDYKSELSESNGTGAIVKLTDPDEEKMIYLLTDLDG